MRYPHAHGAATTLYTELIDEENRVSKIFGAKPDYRAYETGKEGHKQQFLAEPIRITSKDTLRATCVYNTMDRARTTLLGSI